MAPIASSAPAWLSEPSYALGDLVPLEQAVGADVSPKLIARLRSYGFDNCSVSGQPPSALAARAVESLLLRTGVRPGDVDAVLYASSSHRSEPSSSQQQAVREAVLEPLGLQAAPLFGVWLNQSGNLVSALRLARSLLVARGMRTVVVVAADAIPQLPGEFRAMANAVTINGDGAAACLLSSHLRGPYQLEGIGQAAAAGMATENRGRGLREYLEFLAGVRRALAQLYSACGTSGPSYRHLIANNYSQANLDDFADVAGVPKDRLFRDNVPKYGHVFTADALINLAGLTQTVEVLPDERVLLLSTGPVSWGAIGLRRSAHKNFRN
jgi:3-oxoacyl-[acyl-carrier-protein] synthase-3